MIEARAQSFTAPATVVDALRDDANVTLHHQHRGRPRHPAVDAAARAVEENRFVLSAMSSRNWREVYRASGVLQEGPRKRRNLRAALKARYQGRAGSTPQLGSVHPTPEELVVAVQNLKARLCAGLAMEDAMVVTETMSPAEKLAVELWFGSDV